MYSEGIGNGHFPHRAKQKVPSWLSQTSHDWSCYQALINGYIWLRSPNRWLRRLPLFFSSFPFCFSGWETLLSRFIKRDKSICMLTWQQFMATFLHLQHTLSNGNGPFSINFRLTGFRRQTFDKQLEWPTTGNSCERPATVIATIAKTTYYQIKADNTVKVEDLSQASWSQ